MGQAAPLANPHLAARARGLGRADEEVTRLLARGLCWVLGDQRVKYMGSLHMNLIGYRK